MKRNIFIISLFLIVAQAVTASVPDGYYSRIDGTRYTTLKQQLNSIIKSHKVLGYDKLWEYYPSTYYHLEDRKQVLDMYSDVKRYYGNSGNAVGDMNKEHTVPKSWWGGSTSIAPGNDLFNVIPSDKDANSRKSNYPLGEITGKLSWTNNVTSVGKGRVGSTENNVFEPCDRYKGDFARIYFYMAVCYPDQNWDSNNAFAFTNKSALTLKDYIIPMLLEWSNADPVDEAEIQRNEDIYKVQNNRNPFIDYPELAEYIWGSKKNEDFNLSEHDDNGGSSDTKVKAVAPKFSVAGGTADKPYEIADNSTVTISGGASSATLVVRVNNGEWETYVPEKRYTSTSEYYITAKKDVTISGNVHIDAYCIMEERENSDTISYWYNGVVYSNEYLLYEPFDDVKVGNNYSSSGSATAFEGNTNFPTVTKAYAAGNAIKLGSGSGKGSITSRVLQFAGGTVTVSIDVKGWTNVEGGLKVSITGAEPQTVTYTATMSDKFETITLTFENVSANPVLTIETTEKRAFVDNISVKAAGKKLELGDVNGDGEINIGDFTATANHIMQYPDEKFIEELADVNGDGQIDVGDLTCIANIILYSEGVTPDAAQ